MRITVRELPPLRHTTILTTPTGKRYRWAADEPNPANIPSGQRHSSTMPGGNESMEGTLPRKPGIDYADLVELSTIQLMLPGGDIVGEYRLEHTPRVSGDQMTISPSAVGWQAHLADDESASFVGIDRDINGWQGPSRQRQVILIGAGFAAPISGVATPDATTGAPAMDTGFDESGGWGSTSKPIAEALYDAGDGNRIGNIRAVWTRGANVSSGADANLIWKALLSDDDILSTLDDSGDLQAAGPGTVSLSATGPRRYAALEFLYAAAGGTDQSNLRLSIYWTNVRVLGDHGLPIYGATAAEEGILASDLVAYAIRRWAPLLRFTQGDDGTISPTRYAIPHCAFKERTTASEIVKAVTRFELPDWAVWENKTFYMYPRGARGRRWRARIGPAQLQETGPQVDRLWESVIVQFSDVDGSTRTVGPPGSGASVEDAALKDTDPENPANQLGGIRRKRLQAGTLTAGGAIELGRRFLLYQKLLDSSGKAIFVGHVMDDHGVMHPYSRVRAGDEVSFIDAADTSYRRIVRADHDHDSRTCNVDLDAPPDGMQQLLDRLGVVNAALGLS